MKRLAIITAFLIIAIGMVIISVISIQNISAISVQFLIYRSVQIPFGVLLVFSFSVGLVLGAILPALFPVKSSKY
ncbi:DUF1049 domain-containing protein [Euhalothece natronophila Z-M001]|uniref:DUF1049 domain-containing protein n=1 Tax=Euhalothece natronophila Z-M001 TaxID=522448 RepID=A0A5B8NRZ8_9CHRO|nr:lipopolysaccharide assembly protein LapA domain-containing protein [Euhalothece natronophila]QDZ41291.1 DUF1049 domain-containing protein [Euhalothece natronophila Z-M001]